MPLNWTPLWLSLRVAGSATVGALLPGLWIAYLLATRRFALQKATFVLLALLLATPVVILAAALHHGGISWQAAAVLGIASALPMIALGARTAIGEVDRKYGNAARSLGASEWSIFRVVVLPLAWGSILTAASVAFARVLAEWAIVSAL
jgi:molybdate transport system permease protein